MNLKDRLSIKLDNDMRKGQVQFDNWTMSTKVIFMIGVFNIMFLTNLYLLYIGSGSSLCHGGTENNRQQNILQNC
jgi:hypothetical protein